jgi:hypothetical protein
MLENHFLNRVLNLSTTEDAWGSGGIVPTVLTSELDCGEWLTSRPGRFTPGEKEAGTNFIGGWVGPRAGLDATEKRKKSLPLSEIESLLHRFQIHGSHPPSYPMATRGSFPGDKSAGA